MKFHEARDHAKRLNLEGRYRDDYFYSVAIHGGGIGETIDEDCFFVIRTEKCANIHVALFVNGSVNDFFGA